MPTVLKIDGFSFFYSNEGQEPAHIHVRNSGNEAKFWLSPVELASNKGFNGAILTLLFNLVCTHQELLMTKWKEYFESK